MQAPTATTTGPTITGSATAWWKSSAFVARAWQLASLVALFSVWEIAGRVPVNAAFPTFTATFAAFWQMLTDGSLIAAYGQTLQPLLLGVLISTVIGVALGVAMGMSRLAEWMLAPILIVVQAAPMAAFIPLITFMYGIGLAAKTLAVVMLALSVIALNGYKAVRNVSPSLLAMARSFQASPAKRIFSVILPDASPVLFAGLRLGVAAGFIGVILAELLITPTGIGDLISYHSSVANFAHMYATVASIILLASLVLRAMQAFEIRVLRPEKRKSS